MCCKGIYRVCRGTVRAYTGWCRGTVRGLYRVVQRYYKGLIQGVAEVL
jgi:hypothetical protein